MDHIKHETREIMTIDMGGGGKDPKPLKVGDKIREQTDEAKTWENTGTIITVNKRRRYTVKTDSGEFRKRSRNPLLFIRGKEYGFQEREQDPVKDKDPRSRSRKGWLTKNPNILRTLY